MKPIYLPLLVFYLLISVENTKAQDLDPRAYARIPVNVTVAEGF
jgi:hypothetical protein